MKSNFLFAFAMAFGVLHANFTYIPPYNGGNQLKTAYTNPNLLQSLFSQVNGAAVSGACDEIAGVGLPVLSIKKIIQNIDTGLDSTNANTYARAIFFKEIPKPNNFQTVYKLVIQIRTFQDSVYLGVEGIYKQVGFPTFEVTSYLLDESIENIRSMLNEFSIAENGYVGCGDIKSIYSQANPVLPPPNIIVNGVQSNPAQGPYAQGNQIINSAPPRQAGADPAVIAQIIQLLQPRN